MTLLNVPLPLYDEEDYSYSVSLEENSYTLRFIYSERSSLYFLSLYDEDDVLIIGGLALTPNYPLLLDYPLPNLTGWLWMQEISKIISQPYKVYPDKISQYYTLSYSYITEDEE
jgi:hypothetical protein